MTTFTPSGHSAWVTLCAPNGKYLTLHASDNLILASSTTVGPNEKFEMIPDQSVGVIALKAANGKYVSSPLVSNQQDGGLPLIAVSNTVAETEQFRADDWGNEQIALFAPNQKYVTVVMPAESLEAVGDDATASAFTMALIQMNGMPVADAIQSSIEPGAAVAAAAQLRDTGPLGVFTVSFCGTACTRDEGEVCRENSQKEIYGPSTGYIPVRIHREISGSLHATTPSVTIRGVGVNDWAGSDNSETLKFDGPLNAPSSLRDYVRGYSGGNQDSYPTQLDGWSAPALALHAANLAASSGATQYNFIGHSRGAVEAIMAAWFIYAYGGDNVKNIPINIFAIDPVPGTGEWYDILTQLPPNVVNYVGVYAWDMGLQPADRPFMGLVPRPNGRMTGKDNHPTLYDSWIWPNTWKYLAYTCQLTDPLLPGGDPQPTGYKLYACRGRHSTVSGNYTAHAQYDPADVSASVLPVPELIYKLARGYLTEWGTTFPQASATQQRVLALRQALNTDHRDFDAMGGGATRTSALTARPYVRRLSSISGRNPFNSYYMDDVAGNPPYKMAYPVTSERENAGWVRWQFL